MINIALPNAHIISKLILDEKKYDVEDFKIDFIQKVDFKGQPTSEVNGGQVSIILGHIPDDNLYLWAKESTLLKNGHIIFETDLGQSVLRLDFFNAYCIDLKRSINSFSGTKTSLVLSPESLSMNGVEHDNRWNRK